MVKPYTGNLYAREITSFNVRGPGKVNYLYREAAATYIGSREEVKGNNMEDKRKQVRTELRIQSTDWAVT